MTLSFDSNREAEGSAVARHAIGRAGMKPLLSIFIDGLKPESVQHMPFVANFSQQRRIKGEHGYSIACHGSMYSGVHPDVHKLWFVWQYAPRTSPFRNLGGLLGLRCMSTLPGKLLLHKAAQVLQQEPNTAYFGIPRFVHVPVRFLKYLDVTEKRNYDEPGYLTEVPGLFDILRSNLIDFTVVGMDRSSREESKILERVERHRKVPWIYWFIGDVDHFSHTLGQDSPEAAERLRLLDELLERKYHELVTQVGDVDLLLWSDHGHVDVQERIDLYEVFRLAGRDLDRYQHVIDATYARFWFESASDEAALRESLTGVAGKGQILEVEDQRRLRVYPGDNRFGDLIFALHPGALFSRTIWGWSRNMRSMHGYDPAHRACDGVVISNLPLRADRPLELIDITPSILTRLGLPPLAHMEGASFWAQ